MASLFPGKGAHLILNEEYIGWLMERLAEVQDGYAVQGDAGVDENGPESVIKEMQTVDDWQTEKDKFGTKVFAATPYKEGELRVTVVLTSRDELKLDVREWFQGKQ